MTFSNRSEQGKQQGKQQGRQQGRQGRLRLTCTKLSNIFATTGATWQPPKRLNLPHLLPMPHLNRSRIKMRSVINRVFAEKTNGMPIAHIYSRRIAQLVGNLTQRFRNVSIVSLRGLGL